MTNSRKFIILIILFCFFSCKSYRYIIMFDKSDLTEEIILERAIKEEEHILTLIFRNSMNGSNVLIQGESLDFKNVQTYCDQKLEFDKSKKLFTFKVNNRSDISLSIDNDKIELQEGIAQNYRFLIVEKRSGIKLKYSNKFNNH